MTAYDSLRQFLTTFDSLWQLLTTFDHFWQLFTTFYNFLQLFTTYTCTLCKLSSSQDLVVGLVLNVTEDSLFSCSTIQNFLPQSAVPALSHLSTIHPIRHGVMLWDKQGQRPNVMLSDRDWLGRSLVWFVDVIGFIWCGDNHCYLLALFITNKPMKIKTCLVLVMS